MSGVVVWVFVCCPDGRCPSLRDFGLSGLNVICKYWYYFAGLKPAILPRDGHGSSIYSEQGYDKNRKCLKSNRLISMLPSSS